MKLLNRILRRTPKVNTGVLSFTRNGKLMVTNNTIPEELAIERPDREEAFRYWLKCHRN